MNNINTCISLFFMMLCILFTDNECNAQNWQWAARGGGYFSTGAFGPTENVKDVCTDKSGNIYILANVFGTSVDIAGHTKTGHGTEDICIASFTCGGTYRWSKVIGGAYNDQAISIKADTMGGVYITGFIAADGGANIDADTTIGVTYKTMFLLKYDTSGIYKWFKMPEADTVTYLSSATSLSVDMDVDDKGNVYLLSLLYPEIFEGSYVASTRGIYLLKYNSSGTFLGGTHMDITIAGDWAPGKIMTRDNRNGRIYLAATNNNDFYLGATHITKAFYAACFDSLGNSLWAKQDNNAVSAAGINSRPAIDKKGYVYVSGDISGSDIFNSVAIINSLGPSTFPFLAKLDSNGNNIWTKNGSTSAVTFCNGIALVKDTVAVLGFYPSILQWGPFTKYGGGYQVYIALLTTDSGHIVALDTLGGTANSAYLTSDRYGNFYAGGQFSSTLYIASDVLSNAGGETDFFMAKYGSANCSIPQTDTTNLTLKTELPENNYIKIYPNPTTAKLFIEGAGRGTCYRMYNIIGQEVLTGIIIAEEEEINTADLKPGLYIIQLTDSNGFTTSRKIARQRD